MSIVNSLAQVASCSWETVKSYAPELIAGATTVGILGIAVLAAQENPVKFAAKCKACHKMAAGEVKINAAWQALAAYAKKQPDVLRVIEQRNSRTVKEVWSITRPLITEKQAHQVRPFFDHIESLERQQERFYKVYKACGGP